MTIPLGFRKSSLALILALPLLFLSDVLYGLMDYLGITMSITPGIVLRGGLFALAVFSTFLYRKYISRLQFYWLILLMTLAIPSLLVSAFSPGTLGYDLLALIKVLYFPFVTAMLVVWLKRWRLPPDDMLKYIEYSAYCLGITLLFSQQLGISRQTYGDYAFGNLGIFYAQNDMTLAFGLSLLGASYRLVNVQFSWLRFFLLLTSGYACLQIGTRASLAVALATMVVPIVCLLRSSTAGKALHPHVLVGHLVLGILLALSLGTFTADTLEKQQEHSFQQEKLDELAKGRHPRDPLIEAGASHLQQRPAFYDFAGEGMAGFQRGVSRHFGSYKKLRFTEVDWMDLRGAYGWPFTLVLHIFLLWIITGAGWRFLKRGDPLQGLVAAAGLVYLGQSVLAGHALTSPIPSTLMAAYGALFWTWKPSKSGFLRAFVFPSGKPTAAANEQ